tara:strand:+ start:81 stop:902 length:822 start_codon:yes stop_codon:yes gene_type:complete
MINFEELANALNPNPNQVLKVKPAPKAPTFKIPAKLLSKGNTNAKTAKNTLETYILYMSPATQNSKGADLCPFRSAGCTAACLYTAGRGKFNSVKNSRINKADYFTQDRRTFTAQLALELKAINKRMIKKGARAAIRLNGTTDIDHISSLRKLAGLDVFRLSNLVFYDYTKNPHVVARYHGTPYVLTFSRAEDNEPRALEALNAGGLVSAVFMGELPETYKGFKVIDGDQSDDLMLTASKQAKRGAGIILGLKAKGDAKKDRSGFVIDNTGKL